jgi:glycosyltransferase involved in cell wall biosynthesis
VFFQEDGARTPGPDDLPFSKKIVSVPRPRLYTPGKILRALVGKWPLPVLNYYSSQMAEAIADLLDGGAFDLVHFDSLHMAAYFPLVRRRTRAPVVFDWHNIESEAMRRYGRGVQSPARKLYAAMTASRLAGLEGDALRAALGHAVCSERERNQLARVAPEARIAVVENGVDVRSFAKAPALPAGRARLLFVGSMNYHANVDAILFFARAVWPRLRLQHPELRLTIVGSNPSDAVLALESEPGIEITGTVEDVRPYYREAVAAIVPLRIGGGTRLKILEAMAAGVPVVSTALGAEGLAVSPGADILIADSREEWLAQVAALASQGELWSRLACAGRKLVASRYDWDAIGESLYLTYNRWLEAAGS